MVSFDRPTLLCSEGGGLLPGPPDDALDELDGRLLATSVLIVEDEAMIAWMMESLLEEMGFTDVRIAASGEDAVAKAAQLRPGLVVSDINLGRNGMDGVETAIAIRRNAHPPVVFITGYAGAEVRERIACDVPGADLLRKPVNVGDLRRAIVQAIARPKPH